MIRMTESLKQFMWKFYREEFPLVLFGHQEIVWEHWDEYIEWCKTPEGASYLKGGENYKYVEGEELPPSEREYY